MVEFNIDITGVNILVCALYGSTREHCREYMTTGPADFSVTITPEDIAYERAKSAREDEIEGLPQREYSDAYLETIAVQRKITEYLFRHDILLFHGSVVAVDGVAYLFTAKSGTGKSTHTRLWRQMLGDRAVMVNDDKPFLEIRPEVVTAWGSPWMGKHRLGANIAVPLKAICILERGEDNEIRQISAKEALPMLFQQSSRPRNSALMGKYMELIDTLAAKCTFYRLRCNTEPEAAVVSYEAMSEKKYEK